MGTVIGKVKKNPRPMIPKEKSKKKKKNPRLMIPKEKSKAQDDQVWVGALGLRPIRGPC